jgi:hypothetical protein
MIVISLVLNLKTFNWLINIKDIKSFFDEGLFVVFVSKKKNMAYSLCSHYYTGVCNVIEYFLVLSTSHFFFGNISIEVV